MKRKRIIRKTGNTKSELVSSPDKKKQGTLREVHKMELQGEVFKRPSTIRKKAEFHVANPRGYDAHLTTGRGTLC